MLREYGRIIAVICFLACNALSAWGGYSWADRGWSLRWTERDAAETAARLQAAELALTEQKKLLQELDDAYKQSETLTAQVETERRTAADLSQRLRDETERRVRMLQANSSSTIAERANAATDGLVFAELFGRAEQRAANLAEYADRNRNALAACRAEYDIIRRSINGGGG